jgi:hypothetical protein
VDADEAVPSTRSVVLSVRRDAGVTGSTLDGTIMGTPQ